MRGQTMTYTIEEIKKMLEGISPWPWEYEKPNKKLGDTEHIVKCQKTNEWVCYNTAFTSDSCREKRFEIDISFIAKSPQIISELVEEVEKLREALEGH